VFAKISNYPIFIFLFVFGMLSRFTSSEFWPITISKTWLTPSRFETSMLQKPLLTLFLALFHLFKMPDLLHLFLVKMVFSAICTYGILVFLKFVIKKSNLALDSHLINIIAAFFVLTSPTFLNYFFSVRSDQVACVLFSIFLLHCEDKKMVPALITLALIPLFGIKEILFLMPGGFYFLATFKEKITHKVSVYTAGGILAALIWAVALNIPYLPYLFEAYEGTHYLERFNTFYYKHEFFLMVAAFLVSLYIFISKQKNFYKEAILSTLFLIMLIGFPQSYYFYMASMLPFIYLPLFLIILKIRINPLIKASVLTLQILFVFYNKFSMQTFFLESAIHQYKYISLASNFVAKNHFSYMDGIGILPQQKFYPCFVSPFDPQSKATCLHPPSDPDVMIITGRLNNLGIEVFDLAREKYTQIYPNLWVLNSSLTDKIRSQANLDLPNFPLALFIF
jgi:hypothetical protein